jgi:hypothetical protein
MGRGTCRRLYGGRKMIYPDQIFVDISSEESLFQIQQEITTQYIRHREKKRGSTAPWINGYPPLSQELSNDDIIERVTNWAKGNLSPEKYLTYGTRDLEFANDVKRLLKIIQQYQDMY